MESEYCSYNLCLLEDIKYALWDNALSVLIHIRNKGEVGTIKHV